MATFNYEALNASGKKIRGVVDADSSKNAQQILRDKNLTPLDITVAKSSTKAKQKNSSVIEKISRVKLNINELSLFTRQMATLVQSSLPIEESLNTMAQQTKKSAIKIMVLNLRSSVLEGYSLAHALTNYPHVFNNMYVAMVKSGEHSGFLGTVLEKLADYIESSHHIQQKIKTATIYPISLIVVAIIVISALMMFVVPKLIAIFEGNNVELPVITRVLIWLSDYLVSYGVHTLLAALLIMVLFKKILNVLANLEVSIALIISAITGKFNKNLCKVFL